MDIEYQNVHKIELKPGEFGGLFVIISTMTMSFICGLVYVVDEMQNQSLWRPHRAIQGIVIISCVSMFIFVPLGGIIEVCVTNKGTFMTGIKNSIYGACKCFFILC